MASRKRHSGRAALFFKGVSSLLLALTWAWGCTALFLSGPEPGWLQLALTISFAASLPLVFLWTRSFIKGLPLCLLLFGLLLGWWNTLQPATNKDWAADVARISYGEIQENNLTMYNVRNFSYIGEEIETERWETREYPLEQLKGLDIFLSYWASDHIAHTILSWGFGDGQHLAISIETRKDTSQEYSAVKGFFKQFELSYVAAKEQDIIMLRTNYRKERVYLYPLNVSPQTARRLLESYLMEMNMLVDNPEFYNALSRNCTTTIHLHANAITPNSTPLDWRLIASGHLDELLYEREMVSQRLPFSELRRRSRIDLRMQEHGTEDFSSTIRTLIPGEIEAN